MFCFDPNLFQVKKYKTFWTNGFIRYFSISRVVSVENKMYSNAIYPELARFSEHVAVAKISMCQRRQRRKSQRGNPKSGRCSIPRRFWSVSYGLGDVSHQLRTRHGKNLSRDVVEIADRNFSFRVAFTERSRMLVVKNSAIINLNLLETHGKLGLAPRVNLVRKYFYEK